jgi:DNA-binding GntR family transcriptional regulator
MTRDSPAAPQKSTLAEQVYRKLSTAILAGELAAGAKISEPALARQYGVSRGPLREALHRLQERKLITRSANQGPRVVKPSLESLAEIFAVREALEGMAARLSAQNATETEIGQLRAIIDKTNGSWARTGADPAAGGDHDNHDFHVAIAQFSRNAVLIELLCTELYPLLRLYRELLHHPQPRQRRVAVEHEHIVHAIEDRDPDLAEMLMRRHIAAARVRREKTLVSDGSIAGAASMPNGTGARAAKRPPKREPKNGQPQPVILTGRGHAGRG